jgi:hypothetical protein
MAYRSFCEAVSIVSVTTIEKLDGDLRRNLCERPPDFFGGVGQPVCVNVYSYIASPTAHEFARPQILQCLFKLVSASRALKSDRRFLAAVIDHHFLHRGPFPGGRQVALSHFAGRRGTKRFENRQHNPTIARRRASETILRLSVAG